MVNVDIYGFILLSLYKYFGHKYRKIVKIIRKRNFYIKMSMLHNFIVFIYLFIYLFFIYFLFYFILFYFILFIYLEKKA